MNYPILNLAPVATTRPPLSDVQVRRVYRACNDVWQAHRIEEIVCWFVIAVVVLTMLCVDTEDGLTLLVRLWLTVATAYGIAAVWHLRCIARLERLCQIFDIEMPRVGRPGAVLDSDAEVLYGP